MIVGALPPVAACCATLVAALDVEAPPAGALSETTPTRETGRALAPLGLSAPIPMPKTGLFVKRCKPGLMSARRPEPTRPARCDSAVVRPPYGSNEWTIVPKTPGA